MGNHTGSNARRVLRKEAGVLGAKVLRNCREMAQADGARSPRGNPQRRPRACGDEVEPSEALGAMGWGGAGGVASTPPSLLRQNELQKKLPCS